MSESKHIGAAKIEGDEIVIRITCDDLVWISEHRGAGLRVIDKEAFFKATAVALNSSPRYNHGEEYVKMTDKLWDDAVDEVIESGSFAVEVGQ